MTSFERFEGRLPAMLEELATPRLPDYADDLFARTAATRQRPGWSFPERWLPMSALTRRFAAAPRIPWRIGVLVALLAIAALVGVLVAGSLLNPRPSPYGLAANGQIAYVDDAGRIVAGDLVTRANRVVADVTGGEAPQFSRDGARVAFIRAAASGLSYELMVTGADGSRLTTLNTLPFSRPSYVGWSASGDRLLVVDAGGRMLLFDTAAPGEPVILSDELGIPTIEVGLGYNYRSTHAFRPPLGDEIMFVRKSGGDALMAVHPDGSGSRTLIDQTTARVSYSRMKGAEWSPDGTRIVVQLEHSGQPDQWHTYVLDADGTDLRPLSAVTTNPLGDENSPLWSPDGTSIAFQYWFRHANDDGQDFNPIAVVDVATGAMHDVGPTSLNGYVGWQWSPDGTSIIQIPGDDSGEILVVNVDTGLWTTAPWTADQPVDWQRVAP